MERRKSGSIVVPIKKGNVTRDESTSLSSSLPAELHPRPSSKALSTLSTTSINDVIPASILVDVFQYLSSSLRNIGSAALTCRYWHDLIWNRLLSLNLDATRKHEENFWLTDSTAIRLFALSPIVHHLNLSNNSELTDHSLLAIAKLRNLRTLSIRGCIRFTAEGMMLHITALTKLESLDISDMENVVNDDVIACISPRLTNLNSLSLASLDISDSSIHLICSYMPTLTHLDVSACVNLTEKVFESFQLLTGLKSLGISNLHRIKLQGWNAFGSLTTLEKLTMRSVVVSENSITPFCSSLTMLQRLKVLLLGYNVLREKDYCVFSRLSNLQRLELHVNKRVLTPTTMKNFKGLQYLTLAHAVLAENALSELVSNIEVLKLDQCALHKISHNNEDENMFPAGISPIESTSAADRSSSPLPLKRFKKLRSISFIECDVNDVDIRRVCKNKQLQKLNLIHSHKVTSKGFQRLSVLANLTTLNLTGCPELTDKDVTILAPSLAKLEYLSLAQCKLLTDISLFSIATFMKHLKVLNLHHLKISNQGVERLGVLEDLSMLEISGCINISWDAVAKLQKALPRLQINACHLSKGKSSKSHEKMSCSIS